MQKRVFTEINISSTSHSMLPCRDQSKESMATLQRQDFSTDDNSVTSSLKRRDYQSRNTSFESGESSAEDSWVIPTHRSGIEHSRSSSQSYRQGRLSLSIPIAPRNSNKDSISASLAPTVSSLTSLSRPQAMLSPSNSTGFLVALASQERCVFELREELQKAETELQRLKRQWASHEVKKKKGEIKKMEPLRMIQSPGSDGSDGSDIENQVMIASQRSEADKRKGLLENPKISKEARRTFSGTHARTLSLLSPERSVFHLSIESRPVQDQGMVERNVTRTSVLPGTNRISTESTHRVKSVCSPKNMTSGARQLVDLAEDLKEGFRAGMWTFLEDLRQVTIGSEGVNGNGVSRNSCADSLVSDSKTIGKVNSNKISNEKHSFVTKNASHTGENLIDGSPQVQTCSKAKAEARSPQKENSSFVEGKKSKTISLAISTVDELDDPWSIWDSSVAKSPGWSSSTTISGLTTTPDSDCFDRDTK